MFCWPGSGRRTIPRSAAPGWHSPPARTGGPPARSPRLASFGRISTACIHAKPAAVLRAIRLIETATESGSPNHRFWLDDCRCPPSDATMARSTGPKQITDAYLLALAIHTQRDAGYVRLDAFTGAGRERGARGAGDPSKTLVASLDSDSYAAIKNLPSRMICSVIRSGPSPDSSQILKPSPTTSMCVPERQGAPVCSP